MPTAARHDQPRVVNRTRAGRPGGFILHADALPIDRLRHPDDSGTDNTVPDTATWERAIASLTPWRSQTPLPGAPKTGLTLRVRIDQDDVESFHGILDRFRQLLTNQTQHSAAPVKTGVAADGGMIFFP